MESAGLLNIDGAILSGNRVVIDVGALNVFSRQNTSNYLSRERSLGLGVSFNVASGSLSGTANFGSGNPVGSFATVADQAGIRAGALLVGAPP